MKSFLPHEFHVLDTLGQICDIVPLTLHQLPDPVLPLLQGTGHHLILPLLLPLLLLLVPLLGGLYHGAGHRVQAVNWLQIFLKKRVKNVFKKQQQ